MHSSEKKRCLYVWWNDLRRLKYRIFSMKSTSQKKNHSFFPWNQFHEKKIHSFFREIDFTKKIHSFFREINAKHLIFQKYYYGNFWRIMVWVILSSIKLLFLMSVSILIFNQCLGHKLVWDMEIILRICWKVCGVFSSMHCCAVRQKMVLYTIYVYILLFYLSTSFKNAI